MRAAALASAAAFAALAILNALGVLDPIDAFAVRHLMPGLEPAESSTPTLLDVVRPVGPDPSAGEVVSGLWLYPASAPVSALLVGLCSLALWRRGRREAGVLWTVALVAGVAVEVLVKHVVRRPALVADGHHVVAFDGALPSGHTLRAFVVAAALAYVWPRTAKPALAWALTVPPILVAAGWHTPSDVVAGTALAGVCVAVVLARLRPQ